VFIGARIHDLMVREVSLDCFALPIFSRRIVCAHWMRVIDSHSDHQDPSKDRSPFLIRLLTNDRKIPVSGYTNNFSQSRRPCHLKPKFLATVYDYHTVTSRGMSIALESRDAIPRVWESFRMDGFRLRSTSLDCR